MGVPTFWVVGWGYLLSGLDGGVPTEVWVGGGGYTYSQVWVGGVPTQVWVGGTYSGLEGGTYLPRVGTPPPGKVGYPPPRVGTPHLGR